MNNNGLIINGYEWFAFDRGVHSFQKRVGKWYSLVECSEDQLHNGDIDFMTKHNYTLSRSQKKYINLKFKRNLKQINNE